MRARVQRHIPLALTGASLTFGACRDDDPKQSSGGRVSEGEIVQSVERFADALCQTIQRCHPQELEREFENLRGCVDYYREYYTDYYTSLDDGLDVSDPAPCRSAIKKALDCVTRGYSDLSCEAFDAEEYIDDPRADECEAEAAELVRACELEDEVED